MRRMNARLLALFALLTACGGAAARTTTTTTTTTTTSTLTPPPRPWAEMDHDARQQHMVRHVLPTATDLFTEWDADRYADFSCGTCHGADASARAFAMPNPSLITLYATGTIGQQRVLAEHTEACTFMYSRLVPAMQTLLGAAEYDPTTHEGFTCFSCHPRGGEDDPLSQPAPSP
jgi:hypothetical protein